MPKSPNTHSDINSVLHTEEPWLLAITLDSTNLVTQRECLFEGQMVAVLVPFPLLSQAASPTADRDQSHICGSSPLLQHLTNA